MGVMINPGILASTIRNSKRQPTHLMRLLMANLFTQEELQTSSCRGKKSELPALDENSILCEFHMHIVLTYALT